MFMITYLNYGILHSTRSSWSMASKDIKDLYNFNTNAISDMNATFLFTYSLGGIFLSHLGDVYDKRKLIFIMYILIAMVVAALGYLMFGSEHEEWVFFLVKAINGLL